MRQHPRTGARARHVADRVQNLVQVHRWLAAFLRRLCQQWRNPRTFLIRQIPTGTAWSSFR